VSRLRSLAERAVFGADQVVELPGFPGPYADAYMAGVQAHALMASVRLGLWRHLPGTTDALARATGADPERLAVLLNALRALRYVRRRGDRWDAGRRARPWLGKDDGTGMDATVGELAWLNARGMLALDDIVRGGAPAGLHDRPEDDPAWDGYQASMVELHRQVHPVARTLVPAGARRVLDIGGGPGTFAIDLCRERPELQITVADLPGPAARGRERVREAGLEDRITYVEGDATTTDIGSGFDVATCNQLLHNVDRATATALLPPRGGPSAPAVASPCSTSTTSARGRARWPRSSSSPGWARAPGPATRPSRWRGRPASVRWRCAIRCGSAAATR
jgi:hypothetical protein